MFLNLVSRGIVSLWFVESFSFQTFPDETKRPLGRGQNVTKFLDVVRICAEDPEESPCRSGT